MTKTKKKIALHRVNMQKLKGYAAQMAGNSIGLTGYQAAINLLTEIVYIQKGMEKRSLTPEECTVMIHQGGFK